MKGAQKKQSKTAKKLRVYDTSDYAKKLSGLTAKLNADKTVKKDIKAFRDRYPDYFRNPKSIYDLPADEAQRINNEWRSILKKHGVGLIIKDKLIPVYPLEVRIDPQDGKPSIHCNSSNFTQNDLKDFLPFFMLHKNRLAGEVRAGRRPRIGDYKRWRAEFKARRSKQEKPDDIISEMASRERLSDKRMTDIVRSKKYE